MSASRIRTDQEVVDQTNELARILYATKGHAVPVGYQFENATHPDEEAAWYGACEAQRLLTDTDPENALAELEGEP
jgi:hypothetical protein